MRRWGMGRVHQRPDHRQRGGAGWGSGPPGRGHETSIAATMAAASSSVGSGVMRASVMAMSVGPYSGMLPCLRGGSSSFFDSSIFRPSISMRRVSVGSITSSTYPRSAAT